MGEEEDEGWRCRCCQTAREARDGWGWVSLWTWLSFTVDGSREQVDDGTFITALLMATSTLWTFRYAGLLGHPRYRSVAVRCSPCTHGSASSQSYRLQLSSAPSKRSPSARQQSSTRNMMSRLVLTLSKHPNTREVRPEGPHRAAWGA